MPGALRLEWFTVYGVTPDCESKEEFLVEAAYVDQLRDGRDDEKYMDALLLSDVLGSPTSTFRGLKRPLFQPEFEDGYCYCGKPPYRVTVDGVKTAIPPGMVFAVYIFYSGVKESLVAFDWDWTPEHRYMLGHPESWEADYMERVWSAI